MPRSFICPFFFFFNDTATTEIYTLSLHDALPICADAGDRLVLQHAHQLALDVQGQVVDLVQQQRSEEHTSELQSPDHLVCRLLLEKKKKIRQTETATDRVKRIDLLSNVHSFVWSV